MANREIVNLEQGSESWKKFRKGKIGASDAPVIMGVSDYLTPYQLWRQKLDLDPPQEENSAMRRGNELEPIARKIFEKQIYTKVDPKVLISCDYPWMIASLDGISDCGMWMLEIKCPNREYHEIARNGNVPECYYPQLQHQMIVAGVNKVFYMSFYSENDYHSFVVFKNEDYCKILVEKEKEFYRCMTELEAPLLIDKDYRRRDDDIWTQKIHRWREVNEKLKELEAETKELRKDIIDMSGGQNTIGAGAKVTKVIKKGNIDLDRIEGELMINLEEYRKDRIEYWRISEG